MVNVVSSPSSVNVITSDFSYIIDTTHSFSVNPDTGTTGHFFRISDIGCLVDVQPTTTPHRVTLPDGSFSFSTHTGRLNLPHLPVQALMVHIFSEGWIGSLLSISRLCDAGCTATYNDSSVTITDSSNNVILRGGRSSTTRLWTLDLPASPSIAAVVITEPQGTQADIVSFYHSAMFSPVPSTFLNAIKKSYVNFPGLTQEIAAKYMPNSRATSKGHMDQCRAGHRSTQLQPEEESEDDDDLHSTPIPRPSTRLTVFTRLVPVDDIRYTDLTGRFPITSATGSHRFLRVQRYCPHI